MAAERSWPHPGIAELDVDDRPIRTKRQVQARMQPIFFREFVTESKAAGRHLDGVVNP
jgi:hypothetical protein